MSEYQAIIQRVVVLERDNLLRLSGFLEGLLSSNTPSIAGLEAAALSTEQTQKLVIVYASQSGNAQEVAEKVGADFSGKNTSVELLNISEVRLKKMSAWTHALFIVSTHGEGEPPDSALAFFDQMNGKRAPDVANLHYAVIALGDKSYDQFCSFGVWIDERFHALGATRLHPRIDCDVDYQEAVDGWLQEFEGHLNKNKTAHASTTMPVKSGVVVDANSPVVCEVISCINLCTDEADKKVFHAELEAPGLVYKPGDSLGVLVENPPELVEQLLDITKFDAKAIVQLGQNQGELVDILTHHAELYRLTERQLTNLVKQYPQDFLSEQLEDATIRSDFIFTNDWLSLLQVYGHSPFPNAQQFVDALQAQSRRLYSISSSPAMHEDEVHLTVRLREFGEDHRFGLISGSIARWKEGDKARVYLKANRNFRLPTDTALPIVMIGAGTGLAPFRSFLFERQELGLKSPSWLFFGEQHFRSSFLYQSEWLKLLEKGGLSKLTTAFSRDGESSSYVQDRVVENGEELFDWIKQGSVIYVCGSADGMAPMVHQALMQVLQKWGGVSQEEATQRLQMMLAEGQYKRDVY